ncbi:MAG: hypothetical protein LM593_05675 [Candidatus Verstraetearchaeota archaeon]|jgi:H+/Cl- antiporter ClcA|nr:hypothetical protein [Candidatus Verstraetearchaeota archaeon]
MGRKALLSAFAIIGFFLGIAGYYMFKNIANLVEKYSLLSSIDWIIAGIAGAIITVILVVVWAYATS